MKNMIDLKIPTVDKQVKILLISGETINGKINISGYNRVSDFLLKDESNFLVAYESVVQGIGGKEIIINKNSIITIREE